MAIPSTLMLQSSIFSSSSSTSDCNLSFIRQLVRVNDRSASVTAPRAHCASRRGGEGPPRSVEGSAHSSSTCSIILSTCLFQMFNLFCKNVVFSQAVLLSYLSPSGCCNPSSPGSSAGGASGSSSTLPLESRSKMAPSIRSIVVSTTSINLSLSISEKIPARRSGWKPCSLARDTRLSTRLSTSAVHPSSIAYVSWPR